ncbi:MAG: hypothetical protein RLY14_2754, partial [Planctomycetota bacterium]
MAAPRASKSNLIATRLSDIPFLAGDAEHAQWNVEFSIAMAVGISFAGGVFDKNGGAAGDAVDDATVLFTFRSESDAGTD